MARSPRTLLLVLVLALGPLGIAPPGAEPEPVEEPAAHAPLARSPMANYEPLRAGHPLRVVAYALHPVGWAIEWLVARPIHFLVSQPQLEPITGHVPHETPFGDYYPYRVHEDTTADY